MTIVGLDDNKKPASTELYDETKQKTQAEINAKIMEFEVVHNWTE